MMIFIVVFVFFYYIQIYKDSILVFQVKRWILSNILNEDACDSPDKYSFRGLSHCAVLNPCSGTVHWETK